MYSWRWEPKSDILPFRLLVRLIYAFSPCMLLCRSVDVPAAKLITFLLKVAYFSWSLIYRGKVEVFCCVISVD